jgi:pimeloyl-ACP methyl ester carboxylesterase
VRAFHFGPPGRRLFGAYHAPEGAQAAARGVVICQPHGHEYIRTHRALRNLAVQLARQGHPVLRFDYYGCGDSEGDAADGTADRWTADIALAADELRRTTRVSRILLVGVRLGAALAATAASARTDVDALVLWDPVIRGGAYADHLVDLHARWLSIGARVEAPGAGAIAPLGFPLTPAGREALERVDAGRVRLSPATRVQVILSGEDVVDQDWRALLVSVYGPAALTVVPAPTEWNRPESVHTALSPQPVLQAIAAHVASLPPPS